MITLKEIAHEANVSVAAVSYVVNGRDAGQVGTRTRQKILKILKRHDYRPDGIAKALRCKRTGVIGVLMPSFEVSFFPAVLNAIETSARSRGFQVIACQTQYEPSLLEEQLHTLRERRIEGLIVCPRASNAALIKKLLDSGDRILAFDTDIAGAAIPCVRTDEIEGARMAVGHLLTLGHRRVATLRNPLKEFPAERQLRYLGYLDALRDAGIKPDDALVYDSLYCDFDAGTAAIEEFRGRGAAPTALFAPNDMVALGAMAACRRHGVDLPRELSIIGYADLREGRYTSPSLTTIDQRPQELGTSLAALLMDWIEDVNARPPPLTLVKTKLIERESTVSPNSVINSH